MQIVIFGLSITSSWGNGHAVTYRSLVRGLTKLGHKVLFLERDVPWYAGDNRDLPNPPFGKTELYSSLEDAKKRFGPEVRAADAVMIGSFVPQAREISSWIFATARGVKTFYDIDTPVTLAKLDRGDTEYLSKDFIPRYDLYLSFTGGPVLEKLERHYGASMARVLFCSIDPDEYFPDPTDLVWDLGYLGTYSADRQSRLDKLMLEPAHRSSKSRMIVAGPLYPPDIHWPSNVERRDHVPPGGHRAFYNSQRFTLNITREDMIRLGYSPSIRLFEAAACGTPIIGDDWPGLETILKPGKEIFVSRSAEDTLAYQHELPESERRAVADRARERVLRSHTGTYRAQQLEAYLDECRAGRLTSSEVA